MGRNMNEIPLTIPKMEWTPEMKAELEKGMLELAMADIDHFLPQEERLRIYYRYRHREALEAGREPEMMPYLLAPEVSPRR